MDYRVTWSPEALDDIEAIADYIERDSPAYARAVVQKLLDSARNLDTSPNAGRVVPELGDDTIRERFIYSYRLIYRVRGNTVLVCGCRGSREANAGTVRRAYHGKQMNELRVAQ